MTKVCPECGKEFEPNPSRPWQKFCCKKCSERAARKAQDRRLKAAKLAARSNRVCKRCGKIFTPKNSAGVYCSSQCQKKALNERMRAERAAARGTRQCPVCGVTFAPKQSTGVYCSRACYDKAHRDHYHRVEIAARKCEFCGTEFTPKNSVARFCSSRCYNMAYWRKHHLKVEKSRVKKLKSPKPSTFQLSTFQPSAERRVREYLALPAAERWARRGTLTKDELKMAEKMWNQMHGLRMV